MANCEGVAHLVSKFETQANQGKGPPAPAGKSRLSKCWVSVQRGLRHPSFKGTLTGHEKTHLGKYDFRPRLAETKRKNSFSRHLAGKICLGSSRFWLHKFGQISTKIDYFSWERELDANVTIVIHFPTRDILMGSISEFETSLKLVLGGPQLAKIAQNAPKWFKKHFLGGSNGSKRSKLPGKRICPKIDQKCYKMVQIWLRCVQYMPKTVQKSLWELQYKTTDFYRPMFILRGTYLIKESKFLRTQEHDMHTKLAY